MQIISNQTTQANYVNALTMGLDAFEAISVSVWNQTVVMQVASMPDGRYQQGTWGDEVLVPPSSLSLQRCSGVRFKTNPNGTPGIVNAYGWRDGEVIITGGLQLSGTLAGTGVVTPVAGTGTELVFAQFAAPVPISAVSEATANTVVTGASYTFDGATVVLIEFFAPYVEVNANAGGNQMNCWLYEDGVSIGRMGVKINSANTTLIEEFNASRRLTPTAAAHVYSVRFSRSNANGDVGAGAGGITAYMPGYIRITQAS